MKNPPENPPTGRDVVPAFDDAANSPALAEMFAAAAAPTEHDPAALARALTVFRQAQSAPPTPRERVTAMKAAIFAALSTKIAAGAAVAAAATGGIALAASTGVLPGSDHPASNPSAPATNSRSASPAPNLRGLCTAFNAGATSNKGKAAHSPAFTALANAAGGTANIGSYCTSLLASGRPSESGRPGKPSDLSTPSHPAGKPTDLPSHPGGKPSVLPTPSHPGGKPSVLPTPSHPAGKPTALPTPVHPTGEPSSLPTPSHPAGH